MAVVEIGVAPGTAVAEVVAVAVVEVEEAAVVEQGLEVGSLQGPH